MRFSNNLFSWHVFTNRFGPITKSNILNSLCKIDAYYTTEFAAHYKNRQHNISDIETVIAYINIVILTKYYNILPDG